MNLGYGRWRTSPRLWDGGNVVAEGGIVHIVEDDAEESSTFLVWVRLELRVDLNDKGGSDGREQTSL